MLQNKFNPLLPFIVHLNCYDFLLFMQLFLRFVISRITIIIYRINVIQCWDLCELGCYLFLHTHEKKKSFLCLLYVSYGCDKDETEDFCCVIKLWGGIILFLLWRGSDSKSSDVEWRLWILSDIGISKICIFSGDF